MVKKHETVTVSFLLVQDGSQPISEAELPNIEKMIVDVEDGLNETAKTDDSRKSALKTNEPTFQVSLFNLTYCNVCIRCY